MEMYDLLIKGGRVVDPGSGRVGYFDVGVSGNRIGAVRENIPITAARNIVDANGLIVTAGLIDLHTHGAGGITPHCADADVIGILQGVTTIGDAGSVGSHTFVGFRRYVLPAARTRVLCYLNLAYAGEARMPEVNHRADIDEEATGEVLKANRDVIWGIKFRCVSPLTDTVGAEAMAIALRLAPIVDGAVMVHIGDSTGNGSAARVVTPRVIEAMRPGDILSHPYTSWPGGVVVDDGDIRVEAKEAAARGVVIDVARGRMNFTIKNARRALEAGFLPTTISTDASGPTVHGPVFGLADTASIFLNFGMSLEDVVLRVTANPARAVGLFDQIGSVEVGKIADLTVLEYRQGGTYEFQGFRDERMTGDKLLIPALTVKDGVVIPAELPFGSAMQAAARERRIATR